MYLSKLELHGFKSFAQKTVIDFDPGVTAIVGPNGCGKSNVIDAVRWVLGEQRARLLRSDRMENIIFNGTAQKRALGMAEVFLTIENTRGVLPTEYSEVTIGRRLYRSGESEYMLNGTTCRLKDILDLFMDTGMGAGAYSVIELKMIEDILSDNADDRRRLFEEAAGVTKYKLRRKQALNKLGSTQSDLTRLTDLVEEIERNVRSLQRQAQKASRYQHISERLQTLELALAVWDFEQLGEEHRTLDHETRHIRVRAEGLAAQVSAGEAELESQRAALVTREKELSSCQTALNDHVDTVRRLEAEVRVGEERRAADQRALERLGREAEADATRRSELKREQEAIQGHLEEAQQALGIAESTEAEARVARVAAAEEAEATRVVLANARRDAVEVTKAYADARAALDRFRDRRAMGEQEQERISDELATLAERDREGQEANHAAAERLSAAEEALSDSEQALSQTRAEAETRRRAVEAAEEAARRVLVTRDTASAEIDLLQSLVAEGDGLGSALAFLAEHDEWTTEAVTVADLIGCDEEDRLAFDAALGEWTDCLVVDTEDEANEAIARLRVAEQGHATFIVLDRLPAQSHRVRSGIPPDSTPAIRAARVPDAKYEPLLRLLLQNVFILNTLDDARRLRDEYPEATLVTRDGEWTTARGFVSGGKGNARSTAGRLGRKERLERARAAHAEAEQQLGTLQNALAQAKTVLEAVEIAAAEDALEQARPARDEIRAAATRVAVEQQGLTQLQERLVARQDSLVTTWEQEPSLNDLEAAADGELATSREAADVLSRAEAMFDEADVKSREANENWGEARLGLVQAKNKAEGLQRDLERIVHGFADLDQRAEQRSEESERLRESIDEGEHAKVALSSRLDEERAGTDALQQNVTAAEQALLEGRALIADTEKTLRDIRHNRDAALQRQTTVDLRLTEIATRQEAIAERLEGEHGATIKEAAAQIEAAGEEETPFDPDAARAEIPTLRDRIRSLGAVNALALESFEEEQQRLEFLSAQHADLQEAEQTLLDTIEEINATAAARFVATFEQVREAFERLFVDLFGENATATLILDGDDPLEAPIEVKARPKGKKPSTINQLSGGEKTLTAIALLFAIYLVKPSPFCILDEVDAPLDDANIDRFMNLIRSFATSTQFILVTHNKLTMEAADRMYGITMPEPGISRLVGVKFDEVVREEETAEAA